jgi:hypothetical protein
VKKSKTSRNQAHIMPQLEGYLYDSSGNEIKVPEGHSIVVGQNGQVVFVKTPQDICKFIYKSPDEIEV